MSQCFQREKALGENPGVGAENEMKKAKPAKANVDPINNSAWLDVPAKITPTSLTLPRKLTYDQWAVIGPRIARVRKFATWALCDWLNFGERKYGETFTQAAASTGLEPEYLRILKSVGGAVDPSRRRESLSFTHHRLVAPLDPDLQDKFLSQAEENEWNVEQLRREIKDAAPSPSDRIGEAAQIRYHDDGGGDSTAGDNRGPILIRFDEPVDVYLGPDGVRECTVTLGSPDEESKPEVIEDVVETAFRDVQQSLHRWLHRLSLKAINVLCDRVRQEVDHLRHNEETDATIVEKTK
jgi:hypothetical protein